MKKTRYKTLFAFLLLVSFGSSGVIEVRAASPVVTSTAAAIQQAEENKAGAATPKRNRKTGEETRRRTGFERDDSSVRVLFEPVIASFKESCVRIKANDKQIALGTIVSADGQILTKASELRGEPVVELYDGTKLPFQVLGIHSGDDLALIKIEKGDLKAVNFEEAGSPEVGAWAVSPTFNSSQVEVGVLGVGPRSIPREPGALGIRLNDSSGSIEITTFTSDESPAKKAGLEIGDVIKMVNGIAVQKTQELQRNVFAIGSGRRATLTIERDGKAMTKSVVLGTVANIVPEMQRKDIQESLGSELSRVRAGFSTALQTDAPLRPEQCGSPLVDLNGRVLGMNIARSGRVSTLVLPASTIVTRLIELRSGELSPDKIFKDQVQLYEAAISGQASVVEETQKNIAENEKQLATLTSEEEAAQKEFEAAKAKLDAAKKKREELAQQQAKLAEKQKELDTAKSIYNQFLEKLRKGIEN